MMLRSFIKKFLIIFSIFIFIFCITSTVFASDINLNINEINTNQINNSQDDSIISNTTLEVVENTICNIRLEDIGEFEKKIIDYNASEKSVTLQLDFTNLKTVEESQSDAEIFLVIDNSSSMIRDYVGDKTRKQAVIDSAYSLVEKLFQSNPNIKIGVVSFSSLDSSQGETEGTINDASLELELSNSQTDVQSAITNIASIDVGPRTNIEAGLSIAESNFSNEENVSRYVVLLTDGVPNNDIAGNYSTYSGIVATRTRNKLQELETNNINVIAAMINLDSEEIEPTTNRPYRELAEEIFGTEESSTISKYYYIPDSEIENTIVNEIFDNLIIRIDNTLRNITITDYFPQEIVDNFDFEYVATPNVGTVSQTIDRTNNSITWNIELLSEGETASLSYKLTLKDDYNLEIVDQILKTNTHVDITGENNGNELTSNSDDSPTIRVEYTPEEPVTNTIDDNTITNEILPQTGINSIAWIVSLLVIMSIIAYIRIKIIDKKNK